MNNQINKMKISNNKIFTQGNLTVVSNGVIDFTSNRASLKLTLTCPLG